MVQTVFGTLQELFPLPKEGGPYLDWPSTAAVRRRKAEDAYRRLPFLPFDVFAISAHLLEISGAYHHIAPQVEPTTSLREPAGTKYREDLFSTEPVKRQLRIDSHSIVRARSLATIWRTPIEDPPMSGTAGSDYIKILEGLSDLSAVWRQLFFKFGDQPVFVSLGENDPPPDWWRLAHFLMMVADEACIHFGFQPAGPKSFRDRPCFENFILGQSPDGKSGGIQSDSFSGASSDRVCVLPKGRTSPVGCTLRSLSHHLALLPPRGVARGSWIWPVTPSVPPKDRNELNVLLVPFPYSIEDTDFHSLSVGADNGKRWGFFGLHQYWLDRRCQRNTALIVERLSAFIGELARKACSGPGSATSIDAVILPELALDYALFEGLLSELRKKIPTLELMISGLSTTDKGRRGNFVAVAVCGSKAAENHDPLADINIREKHHRWKLTPEQIRSYGLSGGLNPEFDWWEGIDLLSRRVDFVAFRNRSVISAMLCEDLARIDPCQELLRSVGPSIVVALLMDAPQYRTRWPARYATVLAEDPGSAVLSLTSRALMKRQSDLGVHESNGADRFIALWRDDTSRSPIEINCPMDCQAVWLKLWSRPVVDYALDGRDDTHARGWVYGKHLAIGLDDVARRYADLGL